METAIVTGLLGGILGALIVIGRTLSELVKKTEAVRQEIVRLRTDSPK
jgi:hypothetical protein